MTHEELVNLIRGGINEPGGTWADFGAGSGSFTRALRDLLGAEAALYAVDRDARALAALSRTVDAQTITADFTKPLDLPPLDGLLIANALHWVRQHKAVLRLLAGYLKPGGRFLIVEYDVIVPRGYIPFPVPFSRFTELAGEVGLTDVQRVGERKSPSNGTVMYAGMGVSAK